MTADRIDVIDALTAKASQLSAMLIVVSGAGFETFADCSNEIQGNYLWACAELASDVRRLATTIAMNPSALSAVGPTPWPQPTE